jgi:hypothetical protein
MFKPWYQNEAQNQTWQLINLWKMWSVSYTCEQRQQITRDGSEIKSRLHLVKSCHHLIPWNKVLPEKLSCPQLAKKFHVFYGIWMFVMMFKTACSLSLSWARSIQHILFHLSGALAQMQKVTIMGTNTKSHATLVLSISSQSTLFHSNCKQSSVLL